MASSSKLSSLSRDVYLSALLGVLVYVTFNICFYHLGNNSEEQRKDHHAKTSGGGVGVTARNISDGFTALAIQFLHFFLAKCLQFRYVPVIHSAPFMPIPFWLAFGRSIIYQPL
ncbi:hypothetical protein COLO4_35261 [Corchorus olitorius]|uniref:Uncharacterized protein n=1 Tax=Corchorus olitorius TaxID=93759 RepID=A0A1R3GHT4_9ROSI|nr:hypothetical protein COLO4_35261 [Corchorus olitorius]